jgi:hypothetical protein
VFSTETLPILKVTLRNLRKNCGVENSKFNTKTLPLLKLPHRELQYTGIDKYGEFNT